MSNNVTPNLTKEPKRYTVSIVRGENIVDRVNKAIELIGGMKRFVKKGDKVLIKANLVDGKPYETGETVHPETIRTIIKQAKTAEASQIKVGDAVTSWDMTLYNTVAKIAEEEGAEWVDLGRSPRAEVKVENPVFFEKVSVAKELVECDVLINVGTLKTHHLAGVTVAMKNLYGVLELQDRIKYHRLDKIEEVIVDLNLVKPSSLIVVDGGYTTHHWPAFEVQKMDLAMAGDNVVLVDAVAAKVMGADPKAIRYLRWAEEHGLGSADIEKNRILGLTIEEAYRAKTVNMVDYINKESENIKIIIQGACTGCYGRLSTVTMQRFDINSAKTKLYILMGPNAKLPNPMEKDATCILCGNCLAPTFYNRLQGTHVPGCPPDLEAFAQELSNYLSPRRRLTRQEWEKIHKDMEAKGIKLPKDFKPPFSQEQ
ncbi:MAG: DUF362 domain-containing protein [Candidatus Bathyarchaeia archaeon]